MKWTLKAIRFVHSNYETMTMDAMASELGYKKNQVRYLIEVLRRMGYGVERKREGIFDLIREALGDPVLPCEHGEDVEKYRSVERELSELPPGRPDAYFSPLGDC